MRTGTHPIFLVQCVQVRISIFGYKGNMRTNTHLVFYSYYFGYKPPTLLLAYQNIGLPGRAARELIWSQYSPPPLSNLCWFKCRLEDHFFARKHPRTSHLLLSLIVTRNSYSCEPHVSPDEENSQNSVFCAGIP